MLPNYLASIKSSGIYRFVFDRSEAPTPDAQVLRLVIGYSEKGPFNTPVYVEQPDEFIKIFGGKSKKLERYGMWFHRLCLQALEAGPIIAFNIKNFENANPGDNEVEYTTFNPTDSIFHTNPSTGLEDKLRMTIKDLYNTDRFWTLEPEHLEDYLQDKEDTDPTHLFKKGYITITSTDSKDTSTTIFMRGYEPTGYDVSFMEWYSSVLNGEDLPSWLEGHERDLVSQYWAELFIFKGEFTPEIASSENLAKFFNVSGRTVTLKPYITNAFGEKVDTLDALAANDASNFLRKYSGILLPDFRNANNTVVSLDAQVNSENYIHKLMMRLNQDMLFNIDVNDSASFQISDIDTTGWAKGPGYTGPMMSCDNVDPIIFTATWSGTEWNYNEGSHAGEDPDYYQYIGLNPTPDPNDAYTWSFSDTDERFGATGIREGDTLYLGKVAHVVKIKENTNTTPGDVTSYIDEIRSADACICEMDGTTVIASFSAQNGTVELSNVDANTTRVVIHNTPDETYYIGISQLYTGIAEMFHDAALTSSANEKIKFVRGDHTSDDMHTAQIFNSADTHTSSTTTLLQFIDGTGSGVIRFQTLDGTQEYYVDNSTMPWALHLNELFLDNACTTSANLWANIDSMNMWRCDGTLYDDYQTAWDAAWANHGYYVTTRTWDMTLDIDDADMTNFYKCVGSVSYTSRNVRPLYLEGYTYGNPKPASTKQWDKLQWQNYMLDALKVYKGLRIALTSRVDLEYRYLVDTFESYVQNECKSILATLAKEKDNSFALLNWPQMKNFTKCEYTSFRNEKNEFDTKYIPMGGNPLKPMSVYFSLPSQENGASWCAFFSAVKIQDLNTRVKEDVPSAALVSNVFMLKYSKYLPYTIMAGTNRGVLHEVGLLGPDFNFWRGDLDNLEPFGCNCMVYVDRKGTCINSNQTAKQNPVTALSKINVRELVIFLQDEIEKMMLDYHWDFNTPNLQARIKDRADVILETAKNNGGVYAYVNQCDDKTNTDDVINNEMLVLRTSIEPGMGAGKMVQELYIYRKGGLSSTISES